MLLRRSIASAGLALFAAAGCGSVHGLGADGTAGASGGTGGIGATGGTGGIGASGGTGGIGASGGTGGIGGTGTGGGAGTGIGGTTDGGGEAGTRDATVDVDSRACTVKINEVQTGGTAALDEFIELYNTCPDKAFDLSGHALVYRSAAGTTDVPRVAFSPGSVIAAGKPYFVCANTGFSGAADVRYTDGLAADGGGLALRAPDGHVLDSVGWGTATNAFVEGAAAPAPPPSQSIARAPDGHDTDDNAIDFMIRAAATSPGGPN